MIVSRCLYVSISVLFAVSSLLAQDDEQMIGEVIQVAGETVYVNKGRKHGRAVGDELKIMRDGVEVAKIKVVRLADSFCACEVIFASGLIQINDGVMGLGSAVDEREEKGQVKDVGEAKNKEAEERADENEDIDPDRRMQLRGKLALRYNYINDQSVSNVDVHRPSAVVSLDVENIGGSNVSFETRLRTRNRGRNRGSEVRLYDLSLNYAPEGGRFALGVGRLNPTLIAGVGDFDGALMSARIGGDMKAGVFGGFQPSLQSTGFSSDVYKLGGFVHLDRTGLRSVRQSATVAFVGQYQQGRIDREFVYLQNFLWFGRVLSLYQHVELDLNRRQQTASKKSVQLTNLYTMMRVSPSSKLSFSVGYDARNPEPRFQEETTVDSLLNTAFRQGLQGDVSFRPMRSLFLYVRGNVRMQKGKQNNQAFSVGGTATNLLWTGATVRGRYTQVNGAFGKTRDMSVGIGRDLGRVFHLDTEWGEYRSLLSVTGVWDKQRRGTGRLQVYLPRRTFFSVMHTIYRGAFKRSFTFAELSLRF